VELRLLIARSHPRGERGLEAEAVRAGAGRRERFHPAASWMNP
jgi:hypothetical protein